DRAYRGGVKRALVVHQMSALERCEAGIEMVEPFVDQPQRHDLDRKPLREEWMYVELRPEAVGRPQNAACAVPERIAFSLEGKIARQLPHIESILLEPLAKPRLLGAPLAEQEMPEDHLASKDESAVGGEN